MPKILVGLLATLALSFALVLLFSSPSAVDTPEPPVDAPFTAPTCAGDTFEDPTNNAGFAVVDLTHVFGARLDTYNAGSPVPLYDAFGGSVLLDEDDQVVVDGSGDFYPAYPPLCATR